MFFSLLIPALALADSPLADPPPDESAEETAPADPPPTPPPAESPPAEPPPAEAAPPSQTPSEPASSPEAAPVELDNAEPAPALSKKLLLGFKPSPYNLPANPRQQVDFTAYTLEFGEVKLGLASITIGILPHVQVGTSVPLDILGIPNVQAKVHATEGGPFDIAAFVDYTVLPRTDFEARLLSAGGITSVQVAEPLTLHAGGAYTRADIEGNITLSTLPQLLWFLDTGTQGEASDAGSLLQVETVTVRAAADLRFNRRDSLILQGSATVYNHIQLHESLWVPEFLGLEEALSTEGPVPIKDNAVASLAWQFAWEHLELRLGLGVSSVPGAWLLQATELSYRFGGPSRVKEARMRQTWFKNKKDLKKAEQAEKKKQEGK